VAVPSGIPTCRCHVRIITIYFNNNKSQSSCVIWRNTAVQGFPFSTFPSLFCRHSVRLFYTGGNRPVGRPLSTQDNTNTKTPKTYIHATSGFRTHNSSVGAVEISADHAVTGLQPVAVGRVLFSRILSAGRSPNFFCESRIIGPFTHPLERQKHLLDVRSQWWLRRLLSSGILHSIVR
jgi:hypothetical protein